MDNSTKTRIYERLHLAAHNLEMAINEMDRNFCGDMKAQDFNELVYCKTSIKKIKKQLCK